MPSEKSMENLKKGKPFTAETASAAGKKGAAKSAESRKKRALLKTIAREVMCSKPTDADLKKLAREIGLDEDVTTLELLVHCISKKAMDKGTFGDLLALQKILGEDELKNRDMSLKEGRFEHDKDIDEYKYG